MKGALAFLGAIWFAVYVLAYADLIDLRVCIGKPGACNPPKVQPATTKGLDT